MILLAKTNCCVLNINKSSSLPKLGRCQPSPKSIATYMYIIINNNHSVFHPVFGGGWGEGCGQEMKYISILLKEPLCEKILLRALEVVSLNSRSIHTSVNMYMSLLPPKMFTST